MNNENKNEITFIDDTKKKKAWDRLSGENVSNYELFLIYKDIYCDTNIVEGWQNKKSLYRLVAETANKRNSDESKKVKEGSLYRLAERFHWEERVVAYIEYIYDIYNEREDKRRLIRLMNYKKEVYEITDMMIKAGRLYFEELLNKIEYAGLEEMNINGLLRHLNNFITLMKEAINNERLLLGESTSNISFDFDGVAILPPDNSDKYKKD